MKVSKKNKMELNKVTKVKKSPVKKVVLAVVVVALFVFLYTINANPVATLTCPSYVIIGIVCAGLYGLLSTVL